MINVSEEKKAEIATLFEEGMLLDALSKRYRYSKYIISRIIILKFGIDKYKKIAKKHHSEAAQKVCQKTGKLPATEKTKEVCRKNGPKNSPFKKGHHLFIGEKHWNWKGGASK